jgi:hypothetical protein
MVSGANSQLLRHIADLKAQLLHAGAALAHRNAVPAVSHRGGFQGGFLSPQDLSITLGVEHARLVKLTGLSNGVVVPHLSSIERIHRCNHLPCLLLVPFLRLKQFAHRESGLSGRSAAIAARHPCRVESAGACHGA